MFTGNAHMTNVSVKRTVKSHSRRTLTARAENVLIANTKGGGHSFIGLYLASRLLHEGHQVTILNDGDPEKLATQDPYTQYPVLAQHGATILAGDPSDPAALPDERYDVVYDNNGKDLAACKALIDKYASGAQHYVFVGSAGAYEANDVEPMHVEGDPRKASAGHVEVENYLEQVRAPYTVFQPLYMYGAYTGKDCEQWFIHRIIRDAPVCLPGDGMTLTSFSHVDDVAAMMAAVIGNPDAVGEHFNACSDRCITFNGAAKAVAQALGKEADIVYYDPAECGVGKKEAIPFRPMHFFASVDKAKRVLGWAPQHNFLDDVGDCVERYIESGKAEGDMVFTDNEKVLG